MNEDMIKKLENMLQNGEIPNDLKNMINNFSNSKNVNNASSPNNSHSSNQNMDFDSIFESIKNSTSNSESSEKTNNSNDNSNPFSNIDISTIMKMKTIMDKMNNGASNPRSNLLLSLKPYLKPSRKEKVDQYIKIFSMTQIFDTLNSNGGENIKWCIITLSGVFLVSEEIIIEYQIIINLIIIFLVVR